MTSLWRHRELAWSLAWRDMQARYRGSFAGGLWTYLYPLLMMATYYFVFGVVLQSRFPGDPSREGFVLYFLAGMLPWLAMSEAWGRSPTVLWEHQTFIKKVIFPVEILPMVRLLPGVVSQGVMLALFLLMLLALRGAIPVTALWLPLLVAPQIAFTLGVSFFLAATGAFLRDLATLIGFLLTVIFFLTPICYPESALPAGLAPWLGKSPIFVLVHQSRRVLLEGQAPEWWAVAKLWAVAALVLYVGWRWFAKLRDSFADVL